MRNAKVKTTQAVIDNAIADAYNSGYQAGRLAIISKRPLSPIQHDIACNCRACIIRWGVEALSNTLMTSRAMRADIKRR